MELMEFTAASGLVIKLKRINRLDVLKIEQAFLRAAPKPPTKKAETAFGEEEIPDEENLGYTQAMTEWNLRRYESIANFYILENMIADIPTKCPEIESTYARMEKMGVPAPYNLKDADERKIAYIRRMLTEQELITLQRAIRRTGEPTEEEIVAADESFRRLMGGRPADRSTGEGIPGSGSAAAGEGDGA